MRRRLVGAVVAVAAVVALPTASDAAPSKTYQAPFAIGPAGGDSLGFRSAEPEGRVMVGRAYPMIGPISCPGGGAYAALKVDHKDRAQVRKVSAAYTEALIDPYVYLSVGVRDATGRWIGSRKVAGLTGTGTLDVPVRWDRTVRAPLQVVFGLELSTACPHADGGMVRFTAVTVSG